MVGLFTSDRRDEGGHKLFHTLSLKGVGDQLALVDFKGEKRNKRILDLFSIY